MNDLLLIGQYGSGKTTQARAVEREAELRFLSMGECLRAFIATDHPDAAEARATMARGASLPARITNRFMEEAFTAEPETRFVLDAAPRNPDQLAAADALFARLGRTILVAYLVVPDEIAYARQVGRDGDRPDRDPAVARTRIALFHEEMGPVIAAYRSRGIVHEVDGTLPPEEITARLLDLVR